VAKVSQELMMPAADRRDLVDHEDAADDALNMPFPIDHEEQLATRASWLYYIAENTQAQIGKKLGLSRVRVNRLLADAKRRGLVQINISGRLATAIALEDQLKQRFSLKDAVVVPSVHEGEKLRAVLAAAAGHYLGKHLRDGMTIGVGWGQTLRHSLSFVPRKTYKRLSVVSLIGGLTQASAVNPHETASHLADIVEGQCYYFAAPAFTDSASARNVLMQQPMLRDIYERGRKVDLAFVSVGELTPHCTMAKLGLITQSDVQALLAAGAVGDLCSHWLDREGASVKHPLNQRAVGLSPEHMRLVPHSVLVSGGRNKTEMIRGVLSSRLANAVVTDETTAKALLVK
jgi:DNA-binding transcriptional regulator LsrR (DeoR family)